MAHTAESTTGSHLASSTHGQVDDVSRFTPYHFSTFLAMDTPVEIVPRFSMPAIPRMGYDGSSRSEAVFGPFRPMYRQEVPLYLALHLSITNTCTIVRPSYLEVAYLEEVLELEREDPHNFQPLPFYFFEVAKKLLEAAGNRAESGEGLLHNDVSAAGSSSMEGGQDNLASTGRLVQDIHRARQRKLQQSMRVFQADGSPMLIPGIKLTNIVANELEFLRHSFAIVLQQACEMDQKRQERVTTVRPPAPTTATSSSVLSSSYPSTAHPTPSRGSVGGASSSTQFQTPAHSIPISSSEAGQQSTAPHTGYTPLVDRFGGSPSTGTVATATTGSLLHSQQSDGRSSVSTAVNTTVTSSVTPSSLRGEDQMLPSSPTPLQPPPTKKRRILRQN